MKKLPKGWKEATLGSLLSDEQVGEVSAYVEGYRGADYLDHAFTDGLRAILKQWEGELLLQGVMPEFLAYAVAFALHQGRLEELDKGGA